MLNQVEKRLERVIKDTKRVATPEALVEKGALEKVKVRSSLRCRP